MSDRAIGVAALDERVVAPPAPLDEAEQLQLARAVDGDETLARLMDSADADFLDAAVRDEWQGAPAARGLALHATDVGALVGLAARVVAVLVRAVGRFIAGTHHGVWPTIVEELLRKLYVAKLAPWRAGTR